MESKLLVITAGTVAAGVGKEFIRQRRAHDKSEIKESVRYIDTAYLPTRYSDLRDGEWLQMSIDPRFIDNIKRNEQDYPYLKPLLFDDLMPMIQGSGGGSIRYNAAGAVAIGRDRLKKWIHTGITNLISAGDGQVNLSIALVVSAVGATGSGTLERLVEIIIDAAQDAKIPSPIHCDVFILQPGWDVTDLGLANTVALYAEMAASRLSRTQLNNKSYRGRTILVDWGSDTNMASIEQLKEAAATLVRLSNDPASNIAAEYQEREVDNHVLREQDTRSRLPSHLSTATAVTISLGDLQEKIIQRDAARLVDMLVFGGIPLSMTDNGESIITSRSSRMERPANVMLGALSSFLNGQTPDERLSHLMLTLRNAVTLLTPQINPGRLRDLAPRDQASRLRNNWRQDKDTLMRSGSEKIKERGAELAGEALNIMMQARRERMGTGLSLQQLRDDYRELHDKIEEVIRSAHEMNAAGDQAAPQQVGEDQAILRKIEVLERSNRFNKQGNFSQALAVVQNDINNIATLETINVAIEVLEILERHTAEASRNLTIILQKLHKQRKNNEMWASAGQELHIEMHHPLHLAALPTDIEIKTYADQVSIFTSARKRVRTSAVSRIMTGESREDDQLAAFRKWMDDEDAIEGLFKGDIDLLLGLAQKYAREQVDEEVKENNVLKVLIRAGDEILRSRIAEAADKAHPMVSFSTDFAPDLREACHVSAFWADEEERGQLQKAINEAFGQRPCTLIKSKDPTEIAVFYYADGLPLSAITDLTGRCLEAFLKRRRSWHLQTKYYTQNGHSRNGNSSEPVVHNQRVGVPVYSGKDAQQRVEETGVIDLLYRVRGQNVSTYTKDDVPELGVPLLLLTGLSQQESEPVLVMQPAKSLQDTSDGDGSNSANGAGDK
ncbi:MAG TPA: hypothetical protein VNG51_01865 [Ktedonobacteraceae bacterium]|nr:hypothetical protein [Ktedonobacteraceae bacterium]